MPRYIDGNCPSCHGTGNVISSERDDADGYWFSFGDCHCVEYRFTEQERAAIASALLLCGTLPDPTAGQ